MFSEALDTQADAAASTSVDHQDTADPLHPHSPLHCPQTQPGLSLMWTDLLGDKRHRIGTGRYSAEVKLTMVTNNHKPLTTGLMKSFNSHPSCVSGVALFSMSATLQEENTNTAVVSHEQVKDQTQLTL